MTEEMGGTGKAPEPEMPVGPVQGAPMAMPASSKTTPESMMMIGAAVILGGWLLFSIILDSYGSNWTVLVLSALILALVMGKGDLFENLATKATLLKVAGYAIGAFAVIELIWDIRFAALYLDSFIEILGALALFGGSAMVFMGARSIGD
ncbi:MAG TPA: hypothetical protein VIW94_01500 [Acidimicrobiia bacterium]